MKQARFVGKFGYIDINENCYYMNFNYMQKFMK
jgi:hypothetical protein